MFGLVREIVGNDLIGIHVKNRRNVAFTPRQIELRYICCPLLKWLLGTEISIEKFMVFLPYTIPFPVLVENDNNFGR